jgi:hypothetical protein
MLEQILPVTPRRNPPRPCIASSTNPATRLGAATARYLDALHLAAEHLAGPEAVASLDQSADRLIIGLTEEPAWPTLRSHLLLLAATGADPVVELLTAAATLDLTSAHDQAAVLDSRIPETSHGDGPLPWLPGIPNRIAGEPVGDHTFEPDHSWWLSSPTRFTRAPELRPKPGWPRDMPTYRPKTG